MSDQARRVQAQFGGSAAAYVTSPGHAAGDDLDTLVAWGRALAPRRVLDVATGGGHTALAFTRVAVGSREKSSSTSSTRKAGGR